MRCCVNRRYERSLGSLWTWFRLALFIPVALFVRMDSTDLGRLLVLCVPGLIIGTLWKLDWEQLLQMPQAYFNTSRDSYGFTVIGFALFTGTALLGMVLLRRRWLADSPVRILLWVVCLLLLLQGFLITQSRGSWVSLVVAAGFAFILSRRYRDRAASSPQTRILRYTAAILVLLVFTATQGQLIVSRLLQEVPVVQNIVSGKQLHSPLSSFALRWIPGPGAGVPGRSIGDGPVSVLALGIRFSVALEPV